MNDTEIKNSVKNKFPITWIASLFFTEGFPFAIVVFLSVLMYKRLGATDTDIALNTSWFYLVWLVKPFWSPLIDSIGTKRNWILASHVIVIIGFIGVALTIPMPEFFQLSLIFFWVIAIASATLETAADGFYMLALRQSQQSFYVGFRSAFFKTAIVFGHILVILLVGQIESFLSVSPAQIRVVANPNKFFEETIKVDSVNAKELPGSIKIITKPSYLEISTKPKTKDQVFFYTNFARSFNIMNGFSKEQLQLPDTSASLDLKGNVGIVKLFLSKKPNDDADYNVNLDFAEGNEGIKVIEGQALTFNSLNWDKPAFAVIQLDSTIAKRTEAIFDVRSAKIPFAWSIAFSIIIIVFVLLLFYHKILLPYPDDDKSVTEKRNTTIGKEFFRSFARFFEKKKIIPIILFLLFYGFSEAQLLKVFPMFLNDSSLNGGLELGAFQSNFINYVFVFVPFVLSVLIGGIAVSKKGLKYWLLPMLLFFNLPNLAFIFLAWFNPTQLWLIYILVALESFGYGFGLVFILLYMINVAEGDYKTSHYAMAAGFWSLGLLMAGMIGAFVQQSIGYKYFYIWACFSALPVFLIAKFIPLEYGFGKRKLSE